MVKLNWSHLHQSLERVPIVALIYLLEQNEKKEVELENSDETTIDSHEEETSSSKVNEDRHSIPDNAISREKMDKCCIADCNMNTVPSHRCRGCRNLTHKICGQRVLKDKKVDREYYCSLACLEGK